MIQLIAVLAATHFIAPSEAETRCAAPLGTEAFLSETDGMVFVIGELHGTNEAPGFAGAVVCMALSAGESVVLGLEFSADEQPALDAYMASDGDTAARSALLDDEYWISEVQDGRRSHAMMRLIEAARGWRAAGFAVEVEALDAGEADADLAVEPETQRDRAMLRLALAARERTDRVIVLVGNVHARRTAYVFADQRIETLGTLSAPGDLALLTTLYGAGEAWNCRMPDGELVCGAGRVWPGPIDGGPRVLTPEEAEALRDPSAYDYFVYLGPASVSPPAAAAD